MRKSTTDGRKPRDHPGTFYYGILRIDLNGGDVYFVFYHLNRYEGTYYVSMLAGAVNNRDPNAVKPYENVPLSEFLEKHDPWYRDAASRPIPTRPSFPDTAPRRKARESKRGRS